MNNSTISSIRSLMSLVIIAILASMFGGLNPWKKHCREEMEGLKTVMTELV